MAIQMLSNSSDQESDIKLPPITQALLDYLDRLFPDRSPSLKDADREVWFKAGQASVAQKLRREYEALQQNALESTK